MKSAAIAMFLAAFACSSTGKAELPLTVTTWNIEHLGSPGRGFGGGFGAGDLPRRTDDQLHLIADFIKDELKSDVLALQEIGVTRRYRAASHSRPLDVMKKHLKSLGQSWDYYLPPVPQTPPSDDTENIYLAFMWNIKRVKPHLFFPLDLQNQILAGKELFKRRPMAGYFSAINEDGRETTDFLLVNVHFGSGQNNDENHLIAMTLIQHELEANLGRYAVTERDRIILGDLNDNPHGIDDSGQSTSSPALYEHMKFKGYVDLVTADMKTTRLSSNLDSLIDHIFISREAQEHVPQKKATRYWPATGDDEAPQLSAWRRAFSDHLPISFQIEIAADDDDADFFDD